MAQSKEHISKAQAREEVNAALNVSRLDMGQVYQANGSNDWQTTFNKSLEPVKVSNRTFEQLENMGKEYNLFKKMAERTGSNIADMAYHVKQEQAVEQNQSQSQSQSLETEQQAQIQQVNGTKL